MKPIKKIQLTEENYRRHVKKENMIVLVASALELGYSVHKYINTDMIRLSDGTKVRHMLGFVNPLNTHSAYRYTKNKFFTELILADAGILTTRSIELQRADWRKGEQHLDSVDFPVVIKPKKDTQCGDGVVLDITTQTELNRALEDAFTQYRSMLIQKFHKYENEFRVLVLDGAVIGAVQRMHAYITGDGIQTVEELIADKNTQRTKFVGCKLRPILLNAETEKMLNRVGMHYQSIPAQAEYVRLNSKNNLDFGGESKDVTDLLHPKNAELAIKAAKALGLRLAGVDILTNDLSKEITEDTGVICEVNVHPFLLYHEFPVHGKRRRVSINVLQALFT